MIAFPAGTKVWIEGGVTDMRCGMNSLALKIKEGLGRDPHAGEIFCLRGRKGDLVKLLLHDGAQLCSVLDRGNIGSKVLADSAYRSKTNEAWLARNGYVSDIHPKKPKGRPMGEATSRANGRRSKIRAFVEHVFAHQKARMGLFVRTIGIGRARAKIGMANLVYNFSRYAWHESRRASA